MPRASAGESGGRDKVALQNGLMSAVESLSGQSVVLIDDVCTSGAHLIACANFLRAQGASVSTALCLARTVNAQHPTPLQLAPEDVEAESGFFRP
jgi:predicted amidophosphoribosyltransferase